MEIKIGGEWEMSTAKVALTTSCDHSVDVQHAIVVSRAVIFASSVRVSCWRGVPDLQIWRMLLVKALVTLLHLRVRVACISEDRCMETTEVRVMWSGG